MVSKKLMVLAAAGLMAAGSVMAAFAPAPAPAPMAGAVAGGAVDPVHSSVVFKIKHMDKANFYGVFKTVSGSFTFDADAAKSSIDVTVDAGSVDTRNGKRDEHVKSPDFLSVKEFPTITFKSKSFKKTGDNAFEVAGDLTFRGVTKPVTAQVTQTDANGGGLEATFSIKRSDFGNNTMVGKGLGDEVSFIVSLEVAAKRG
ncbi:MAG: YceI family protein [Phycisphaerales bacterium]